MNPDTAESQLTDLREKVEKALDLLNDANCEAIFRILETEADRLKEYSPAHKSAD